ncbi:hypothetical protein [Paraburkholderia guartelaensis]|uniref:hypothetical protein n=1 Tax=Paraburkholderia guartelaensis TaxID=2546446 RepID=UPI001FEB84F3|nr:hypothetical protein [Paraburkholderia guartelaensis]
MENPAAAADERARVALQTDRRHVRLDAAAVLHRRNCMRISAKASVRAMPVSAKLACSQLCTSGFFMRRRRRDPGNGSTFSALFLGNPMKLTSAKMLEIMESSREYLAGELARRFDTSMAQINDMLCTLAEEGLVRMSSHSSRIVRLERLSFAPLPPTPLVSDTATRAPVSTPPFARQMHGWSRNCEASLLGVHSFAMPVRPSR